MPIVKIEMFKGRSIEQKRELVDVFTKEMERICKVDAASIYIIIEDIKKENWGAGGKLCSDKHPD
jgi:4-oxalocrotonate tautomerase